MTGIPGTVTVFSSIQGSGVEIEAISLDDTVERIHGFFALFGSWPIMKISGLNPLADIEQMLWEVVVQYDLEKERFFMDDVLLPNDAIFTVMLSEPQR